MGLEKEMIDMAHHHHIKMNTNLISSYPKGIKYEELGFESKLLSIVDVYQALIGKRTYKKPWSPPEAIRYLESLAGIEFSESVWMQFLQVVGKYPLGSLVQLSDNSLGFVIKGAKKNIARPAVAIVKNSAGEKLSTHPFVDLDDEQDLRITKDVHVEDHFGNEGLQAFIGLQVC